MLGKWGENSQFKPSGEEYQYNVKKYLYDKREISYEQFISIIYTIMEDTKKTINKQMTESDKFKMMSDKEKDWVKGTCYPFL